MEKLQSQSAFKRNFQILSYLEILNLFKDKMDRQIKNFKTMKMCSIHPKKSVHTKYKKANILTNIIIS